MSQNENEAEKHQIKGARPGDGRRAVGQAREEVERIKEMGTEEMERLRQMGGERLDDLREMGSDLGRRITEQVHDRPMAALGVAFGAGIVASTLLTSRIGRLAILAAGGYVVKQMLGEGMLDQGDDEDVEDAEERPRRRHRRAPPLK